ncbi:MAG: 2-C-methyl-D-erythritol 4-phosphate cytidylyltransferase [Candidatus Omnitrophica bacterium]|nr:2-C-methyl-D-erythritol 4-phosphate cytidylyltransferase [Candidatus Omnitrophota bacterium]
MFVSAIVPAAGLGLRLNSHVPKPLVNLGRKPIFIRTLDVLSAHPVIKEIILVVSSGSLDLTRQHLKKSRTKKIKALVVGGCRRRDSVLNGLSKVSHKADFILIHDAVRPFIDLGLISRVIEEAQESGAAVLGVPVKSTVKEVDRKMRVIRTLKRERLYEIQTPQVFKKDLIVEAYKRFPNAAAVDDAFLVEKLGREVSVVLGSYFNIKITTQEDLVFARSILQGDHF